MTACLTGIPHRIAGFQTGMVLLLCLIFLMALTLLGLSASADTILQSKLASNLQDSERARQSALLALSWAESWILEFDGPPPESCSTGCDGLILHASGGLPLHPESESHSWWLQHGHEAGIDPLTGERLATLSSSSIDAPVWAIEAAQTIPAADSGNGELQTWYRILARGTGQTDSAVSVIESIIVRSWPAVHDADAAGSGRCPGSELPMLCGRFAWRELR
jgi:Tfp pilus assembly protein PilX